MADENKINEINKFSKLTVTQLKDFLSSRGQPISGNKAELIRRAEGANKLGLSDQNAVKEKDRNLQHLRDQSKLKTPLGETLTHPRELKTWTKDLIFVPDFSENEIYNYLVLKMNSKKLLKSRVFYEDRHVHGIELHNVDENCSHCYIKAKVLPSLPTANKKDSPDYDVWIMLSKVTGCVNSAECNCTAGQGEACNHIAALLYAVCDISHKKKDGKLAPTSSKCLWSNPRKRKLSPKKAQDLLFRKYTFSNPSTPARQSGKTPSSRNCTVNVERFRERLLKNNSKAGWLTNFPTVPENVLGNEAKTLPVLHSVLFQYTDDVDLRSQTCREGFLKYFNELQITERDCVRVECLTRQQSDNDSWKSARKERITASNFGRVVKRSDRTPPDSLLKDLLGYREFDSCFLRYGRNHEAAARRTYVAHMRKNHPGLHVKTCGLCVSAKYPHLGASPDGLVYCCCPSCKAYGNGLLEIKCPASMKWRMLEPKECAKNPDFYCYLTNDGDVVLKKDHIYYYQIQGQMALTNLKWCDFVIWTCSGKVSVERIMFNESVWVEMLRKLNRFYIDCFIPELFSSRVRRGLPLFS